MTPAVALLEDARQRPDDDTPRLILADWLEEHGEESRGRMVRAQCQAARLTEGHPERIEHESAALELRLENEPRWLGALQEGPQGWATSRGLYWIETTFAALVRNLANVPAGDLDWVEGIALIGKEGWDRLQASHPLLHRLAGLDLSGSLLGVERLHALLSRFPAGQLRHLDLSFNELDDDGLETLLQLPALSDLTQLELRHNHLTHLTASRLRSAPCWSGLRAINLRENPLGLEGLLLLSRQPAPSLRSLGLASTKLRSVHGLAELLASPLFAQLTHLDLGHTGLGTSGMEELARYKGPTHLRRLNLEVNRIDDSALAHLARSQVLAGVETLSLSDNPVTETGAMLLAESRYLGRMTWLSLDHSQLEARGLRTLLRSAGLASLTRLDVSRAVNPPKPGDLDDLTSDEVRVPLTTLNLTGVKLGSWSLRGVYALLESLDLRRLDLARNLLGPASCPWLTDCAGLKNLHHLGLAGNNLSGLESLTRSQVLRRLGSLDLGGVPLSDPDSFSLAHCEVWPQRLRLIASPLGLSRSSLDLLRQRSGRLDDHGVNVPRWFGDS